MYTSSIQKRNKIEEKDLGLKNVYAEILEIKFYLRFSFCTHELKYHKL